jgi:hypothetical protein
MAIVFMPYSTGLSQRESRENLAAKVISRKRQEQTIDAVQDAPMSRKDLRGILDMRAPLESRLEEVPGNTCDTGRQRSDHQKPKGKVINYHRTAGERNKQGSRQAGNKALQ